MDDLNLPTYVRGTTPAVLAADHINYDLQQTLLANEGIRIVKVHTDTTEEILAEGFVPPGGSPARTWALSVHLEAKQSPTVPLPPIIETVSPANAQVDDSIIIQGSHLPGSIGVAAVTIGGEAAVVAASSAIEMEIICPFDALEGLQNIVVTDTSTGLSDTAVDGINIVPPSADHLTPTSGRVSTTVTITGDGFSLNGPLNFISFNGSVPVNPVTAHPEMLTVQVPPDAVSGLVSVSVGINSDNAIESFTRTNHTISSLSPTSGPVGTPVTVNGANFSSTLGHNVVKFNGTTAVVTSASGTALHTTVPVGATTGTVSVAIGSITIVGPVFTVTP